MRTLIVIITVVTSSTVAFARWMPVWTYDQLTREADVIVIGTPVSVHDTTESTTFPGVVETVPGGTNSIPIPAIGVETVFTVLAILKGDTNMTEVVFHHLRETGKMVPSYDQVGVVTFNPEAKKRFLLFLKRESDGRYISVTGQTDPIIGVRDLGTYP